MVTHLAGRGCSIESNIKRTLKTSLRGQIINRRSVGVDTDFLFLFVFVLLENSIET